MIVIGSDPHKRNHALCGGVAVTGELLGSEAVEASAPGWSGC